MKRYNLFCDVDTVATYMKQAYNYTPAFIERWNYTLRKQFVVQPGAIREYWFFDTVDTVLSEIPAKRQPIYLGEIDWSITNEFGQNPSGDYASIFSVNNITAIAPNSNLSSLNRPLYSMSQGGGVAPVTVPAPDTGFVVNFTRENFYNHVFGQYFKIQYGLVSGNLDFELWVTFGGYRIFLK